MATGQELAQALQIRNALDAARGKRLRQAGDVLPGNKPAPARQENWRHTVKEGLPMRLAAGRLPHGPDAMRRSSPVSVAGHLQEGLQWMP
jgi:hypothetical protein